MKTWQDFDWEQLSSRQRMSPLPNVYSMEAISSLMEGVIGRAFESVLMLYEGHMQYVFLDGEESRREGQFVFERIKDDPKIFAKLVVQISEIAKPFLAWLKEVNNSDLSKLSSEEIANYWEKYRFLYRKIYSRYFVILSVEKELVKYLNEVLAKKSDDQSKNDEYFTIMTTEPRAMVNREEEIAALRLAVKIANDKKWPKIFEGEVDIEKIRNERMLNQLISQHEANYFWVTRDYEDPVLTYEEIVERLKGHLHNDPEVRLSQYEREIKDLPEKRKSLAKKLGLSKQEIALFEAMRDGIHLKETRKTIVSKSLFYFDAVLAEIGKRSGLTFPEIRYLIGDGEVAAVLQGEDYKNNAQERLKRSAYYVYRGKTTVLPMKDVNKLFGELVEVKGDIKEFKGFPAAAGRTTGIARVVMDPEECKNVKPGEIIVTTQAVPSFSSAIAISAGMVCDGGTGITSHPATLAREAKIPCVLGTKIATKVIKNGDKLAIDGSLGIVKKL